MMKIIKTIPLTNLIVIGLLGYILFSNVLLKSHVMKTDTTIYENQMKTLNNQLEKLSKERQKSDKKLDSLKIILTVSSLNINQIKSTLKNEKELLDKMSDDENYIYFHNYIDTYNRQKSSSN